MDTLFKIAEAAANGLLFALILMSVISFAIVIERYFALKKLSAQSAGMVEGFKSVIANQDLEQMENLAKNNNSLEGRALGYGLKYVKTHGASGLDELFNSFKMIEKPGLERNLNFLGTIASNAPYVGLLGTVMGIMKAFNDLANSPGQGNEVVMAGIAHALVATAVGLMVAIPAVVAFNFFQKKVGGVLNNIDAARDLCLVYIKSRKG